MKIYVVECLEINDCYIVDIFDSLEKANKAVEKYKKQNKEDNYNDIEYSIIPWILK